MRRVLSKGLFLNESGGQKPLTCVLRILDVSSYHREGRGLGEGARSQGRANMSYEKQPLQDQTWLRRAM